MHMPEARLLHVPSDINGLVQPEEIGLPSPGLDRGARFAGNRILFQRPIDLSDEYLLLRKIMNTVYEVLIPVLGRLIGRPANRKHLNPSPLPLELHNFPITESLAERREPLKEVGDVRHGRRLYGGLRRRNWIGVARPPCRCT